MAGRGKRDSGKERFWRRTLRQWRRSGLGDGLAIWYRRLEEGTFVFPKLTEGSGLSLSRAVGKQGLEIRSTDLAMLLDGVDLTSVKRQKRYQRPAAMTAQATTESP